MTYIFYLLLLLRPIETVCALAPLVSAKAFALRSFSICGWMTLRVHHREQSTRSLWNKRARHFLYTLDDLNGHILIHRVQETAHRGHHVPHCRVYWALRRRCGFQKKDGTYQENMQSGISVAYPYCSKTRTAVVLKKKTGEKRRKRCEYKRVSISLHNSEMLLRKRHRLSSCTWNANVFTAQLLRTRSYVEWRLMV